MFMEKIQAEDLLSQKVNQLIDKHNCLDRALERFILKLRVLELAETFKKQDEKSTY